jgi:hypothetical protein
MNWKNINAQKNVILAVVFGIIAGVKDHSVIWGVLTLVIGFGVFNLMDWMRAPIGQGPLDKIFGIGHSK